jgi:hypothetical protein
MLPIMATGLQASPIFASVVHCCSSIYNKWQPCAWLVIFNNNMCGSKQLLQVTT